MSNDPQQENDSSRSMLHQIRIAGHLDNHWAEEFGGFTITRQQNGDTFLTGPVMDQAALFGILKKVRDLGMQLISIERVESTISDVEKGAIK